MVPEDSAIRVANKPFMSYRLRTYLLLLLALLTALPMSAKKKKPQMQQPQRPTLTVEQQQQFTYYWYAAKQAIEEERYPDALVLLTFCEELNPYDGATLDYLGTMYDAMNERETALQLYRRACEADPRDQWFHYAKMLSKRNREGDQDEAMRVMENAHRLDPANEELIEQLRQFYTERKQWKEALAMQDKLDAIKGYDAWSALNRYRIYAMWEKPKQAIEAIDKYLELDPGNLRFLMFRLELLEHFNAKPAERFAMYEQILSIDPGYTMILNNYAYLLATTRGDLAKAERMSSITIREEPDNPVYLDTYGWILYLQGQKQLALFYLEKALMYSTPETRSEIEKHLEKVKSEKK